MSAPAQRRSGSDRSCRHSINIPLTQRFLSWIHVPELGGCFELRAPHARVHYRTNAIVAADSIHATVGGWYDNVAESRHDLSRVEDVSIYACFNPVDHDLCGRKKNKIGPITKATKDEHIIKWVRFYLDFDSVRIEGISATDDELARTLDQFHVMLDAEPELAAACHWGCSGNGAWGGADFVPLDLATAAPLVEHALLYIAARYSLPGIVKIGTECKNASRIGCVPGTWKCKGEDLPGDRPWRQVSMDSPDEPRTPLVLPDWLADRPLPEVSPDGRGRPRRGRGAVPKPNGDETHLNGDETVPEGCAPLSTVLYPSGDTHPDYSGDVPVEDRLKRAKAYLATKDISVQGDNGSARIRSACHDILWGFGLTVDQARPMLQEWNQKCDPVWEEHELEHSMERGYSIPDREGRSRGYKLDERGVKLPDRDDQLDKAFEIDGKSHSTAQPTRKRRSNEAPDDPHRLARVYVKSRCTYSKSTTILFHRDSWMKWSDNYYREVSIKQVQAEVNKSCKDEFDRVNEREISAWKDMGGTDESGKKLKAPLTRKVGTRLIGDVTQALSGETILDRKVDSPCWLSGNKPFPPAEILPCKNSLIHLPSFVDDGSDYFLNPTPLFFNTYSLGYDFNPVASEPAAWLRFLDSLWKDDQESIDTLQDWFGYCLTANMRQQKILTIIGPKRAGKDTIGRVLTAVIGEENVAGPTLSGLATNFGLAPLIGKPLAVISDARLSGRSDAAVIVERLLTISGEGTLNVDRKNTTTWIGKLPTRIVIISNELPRLSDSSGALASRLILLKLTESFYGREDLTLFDRLSRELPGILRWSITGWKRLRDRGAFIQPKTGKEMVEEMEDLASPVGAFLRERCVIRAGVEIEVKELYRHWKYWCEEAGRKEPGDIQLFGRSMHALYPKLKVKSVRADNPDQNGDDIRERVYVGFRMRLPADSGEPYTTEETPS